MLRKVPILSLDTILSYLFLSDFPLLPLTSSIFLAASNVVSDEREEQKLKMPTSGD